jgi:hypothetical protein
MNIQTEKLEILKMIIETNSPSILESIKSIFVKSPETDFWESFSYDQKEDILQGIREIDNGEIVDYSELMVKHR